MTGGPGAPHANGVNGDLEPGASFSRSAFSQNSFATRNLSFSELQKIPTNPGGIGLPRRNQTTVELVREFVRENEGDKAIQSVLVCNNGLAAVKFMRSIRMWAQQTFNDKKAITLVAMATPEDIRINAEHITMADQFVEVPGGTNNNNYANVKLIVQIAVRCGVDAVWPGWGHASENPELPKALAEKGIRFLGPAAEPMAALGDKIGSTILAQAAGVPTLGWSGSGVAISFEECGGVIPQELYDRACVFTLDEAIQSCQKIGYPIMLKASWGGGGKGIRKVHSDEEVTQVFKQIQGEVPGSPIFAMKLAPVSRHLEVQLLADMHGNVCSLMTRDCSIQRRHQKIVEEGPAVAASPDMLREMERCARALARSVRYTGAATVEYLYLIDEQKYCFLELNPRLQVEHPVTEGITNVNIPAAQLMVGMGIPLYRIPDIRAVYGQDKYGKDRFDLEHTPQRQPDCHVVAVRITSENAGDGFKPTAGRIDELGFKPTPEVWGYFSVKGGGGIHEFSDSQFGHLFATGATREQAIRAMVVALRDVRVRGEIHTIIDYAADMLQSADFVNNKVHTGWLDSRIAANVKAERPAWHLCVIGGAVVRAHEAIGCRAAEYLGFLSKGQLPPPGISLTHFEDDLVIEGYKYHVKVLRRGPYTFNVALNGSNVDVVGRKLGDGGFLLQVDGESHVLHTEEEALGTRLVLDTLSCLIAKEADPSRLIAASPGKLVRQLVADGDHVEQNQAYAEVEVMKMMMPVLAPASGHIRFCVNEGAALAAGDLIARLDLDDPTKVKRAEAFKDAFPKLGPPQVYCDRVDYKFTQSLNACKMIMAGYIYQVDEVLDGLVDCLDQTALPLLQWNEEFSFVEKRLPEGLVQDMEVLVNEHAATDTFPGKLLVHLLRNAVQSAPPNEKAMLQTTLDPLMRVATAHVTGTADYAFRIVSGLLEHFIEVEEKFQSVGGLTTEQEIIDNMRKQYANNHQAVLDMVTSHQGLELKVELVKRIFSKLVMPAPVPYRPLLRRLAALSSKACNEVALRAQQLLEVSLLADMRSVVARALSGLEMFSGTDGKISPAASAGIAAAFSAQEEQGAGAGVVPRKATIREGVYSGLTDGGLFSPVRSTSPHRQSSSGGPLQSRVEHKIETLVAAPAAVEEALATLVVDPQDRDLQYSALVTYIKRVYHPYLLREPTLMQHDQIVTAAWVYDDPRFANTNQARHMLGSFLVVPCLSELALGLVQLKKDINALDIGLLGGTLHISVSGPFDEAKLSDTAKALLSSAVLDRDIKVTNSMDLSESTPTPSQFTAMGGAAVAGVKDMLRNLQISAVSLMMAGPSLVPVRNGYTWDTAAEQYVANPFLRQVEPPVARLLEMDKLSGKTMVYNPSRNRQWHLYSYIERKDARAAALKRLFLRGLVRQLGHPALLAATYSGNAASIASAAVNELEEPLLNCLEELKRPSPNGATGRADWVHMYHSVLPLLPLHNPKEEAKVSGALRSAVAALVAKHSSAFRAASVAVWEIRFRVPDVSGAWRVLVSCPTGHEAGEEHVEVYREALLEGSPDLQYAVPESESASVDQLDSPLHGKPIMQPYASLEPLQQKRLAARRFATTYCYDYPTVFENALRDIWAARAVAGEPHAVPPAGRLVEAHELVLAGDTNYRSSDLKLERMERGPGENDVGMVAWMITLKTPECPQGRQIIAVANDITHQAGAFGPKEDALFKAAAELSLEEKLPLIYLAANSGARIGVANEVRDLLRIQWLNEEDPTKGFEYLYLDDSDYVRAVAGNKSLSQSVRAELAVTSTGEKRWVIKDIIGLEDGLGVENLSGSGAIGSIFCKAWREGFTISMVSGRTVGIGAYLARLGRRCVQRKEQPIILTGYSALNKVLGRQVYTSNMQLGGPSVMGVNGVSHYVVDDDLEGVKTILRWLSYAPPQLGAEPPHLPTSDPVERSVAYLPASHEKLDPRAAIAGRDLGEAGWESGMFDRGSWTEAQAGWARTVVTGRARLGGIPVGVIAVETQTVMRHVPADPGIPDSSEQFLPQAGQVWAPDSADKTAQAMEEFDREGLPLFILANWRGFSGGQRDLFDGVLQAGSLIVEQLRVYRQPVFVYIPYGAELRGGAWVVVDAQINPTHVEMYADPKARGGVLEPEGVVEIKFRQPDLIKAMHRLDPVIKELKATGGAMAEQSIRAREKALLPVYTQMATQFADMHDTPHRMYAKGVLDGIVPWQEARRFFAERLKRRLTEEALVRHVALTDSSISRRKAIQLVQDWYLAGAAAMQQLRLVDPVSPVASLNNPSFSFWSEESSKAGSSQEANSDNMFVEMMRADKGFLAWAQSASGRAQIAMELKAMRSLNANRLVQKMLETSEGKEGLLKGLQHVLKTDTALSMQLRALLSNP